MKLFGNILLALVIVGIAVFLYERHKKVHHLVFVLPNDHSPEIWGKKYWSAFHALAADIRCSPCKGFAEKFVVYFRDLVNAKIGKPIFDQTNFDYFNSSIAKLNEGKEFKEAFAIEENV